MRKLLIALLLTLLPLSVSAVSIQWDLDADHSRANGYTVYYSDGTADYNKTFLVSETVVNEQEGTVRYENIEENLNLHPGVEYTFTLTRYNEVMESDHSNSVAWTRPSYNPPTDQLPDPVSPAPSGVNGLGVE